MKQFIKQFNKRSLKYGGMATLLTVLLIVAVIIVNVVCGVLVEKFPLKADLTANKLFELTDETKEYLSGLDKDVRIIVLSDESTFDANVKEILTKYQYASDKINVEYVDIYKNPSFAMDYSSDGQIAAKSIIIESEDRFQIISYEDLYDINKNYSIYNMNAERELTSAVIYVTANAIPKVTFIDGHEETAYEQFENLFKNNGVDVAYTNLALEEIDPDTRYFVICSPKRDFSVEEIAKLETFLDNDGKLDKHLIVLLDPQNYNLENLEGFLREWGIGVKHNLIADEDSFVGGNPVSIVASYGEHDISTPLAEKKLATVCPSSTGLELLFSEKDELKTSLLLASSAKSYAKTDVEGSDVSYQDGDTKGQSPIAALSYRTRYDGQTPHYSGMVVIGSSSMAADNLLTEANFANADFFVNIINYLGGDQATVNITYKDISEPSMAITNGAAVAWAVIFVVVIPMTILVIGLVIWLRRRHL